MDVRLPDGRIIRNVPEGTTRSQLMERVGRMDQMTMQEPAGVMMDPVQAAPQTPSGPPSVPFYYTDDMGNEVQTTTDAIAAENAMMNMPTPINPALQGVGRGLFADLLGAPADINAMASNAIIAGLNQFAGTNIAPLTDPYLGSDHLARGAAADLERVTDFTTTDPNDMPAGDKYAYNAARFGSSAGVGALAGATRASKLAKSPDVSLTKPNIVDTLAEPYLENTGKQVISDVASGTGAGVGFTAADEAEMGPVATLMATLFGAGGGSRAMNTATGLGRAPVNAVTKRMGVDLGDGGELVSRNDTQEAARQLKSYIDDPLVRYKQRREGFDPLPSGDLRDRITRNLEDNELLGVEGQTTGPLSEDYALTAAENQFRVLNPVPFKEADDVFKETTTQAVADLSPQNADVTAPQRAAQARGQQLTDEAQEQLSGAKERLTGAESELQVATQQRDEVVAPVQAQRGGERRASTQIDEQVGGALDERTAVKNEAFDEAAQGAFVNAKSLLKNVEDIEAGKSKLSLEDANEFATLKNKIRKFIPEDGTLEGPNSTAGDIPAGEVIKLRRELNSKIRSARAEQRYDQADLYKELKSSINQTFDLDPNFAGANKIYKEEYAPFFTENYGQKYRDTVQRSSGRTDSADAEKISDIFLTGAANPAEDLARIIRIAPNPKAGEQAVENYMAAKLASVLGENPKPQVVAKWMDKNKDMLDQFPEIQKKFKDMRAQLGTKTGQMNDIELKIKNYGRELKGAERTLADTERRIQKGILGTLINNDPDKYISTLMGGKDRLQKLDEVNQLVKGNKQAQEGLRKAVVDNILDSDTNVDGFITLSKLKSQDRAALAKVMTPDDMNTLQRLERVMERQRKLNVKAAPGSDSTTSEKAVKNAKLGLEGALKVKYGVLKGGGIMRTVNIYLGFLPDNQEAVNKVLQRAMLDPKVAKLLLDTPVKQAGGNRFNKELITALGLLRTGEKELVSEAQEDTEE